MKNSIVATLALLFASSNAFAQFTQAQLVEEWQRAKNYTKEYLDAMPEEGYTFKPTAQIRSFAQQMLHLADGNYLFSLLGSGKASPMGQTGPDHGQAERTVAQTKEATTRVVMDSYDFAIKSLKEMTPGQTLEPSPTRPNYSRMGMFGKGLEHQTHHRGQTTVYLRLKCVTPPGEKLF